MKQFELYEPQTLAEAAQVLTQLGPKARILGGGSDLVGGIMKDWVTGKGMPLPDALIDLTTVPGLDKISAAADGRKRGADGGRRPPRARARHETTGAVAPAWPVCVQALHRLHQYGVQSGAVPHLHPV